MIDTFLEDFEDAYTELASKQIQDSDGFLTDYVLYTDGERFFTMFGDSDLYDPNPNYADAEFDTEEEAREWFDSYNGFADEDDDYFFESVINHRNNKISYESAINEDLIPVIGVSFDDTYCIDGLSANSVDAAANSVMDAYQTANKWLDSVKECIYTNMNCPFFSSFVHELAHTMPGRFDKFGDILHTVNMEIPYPATREIEKKPATIQEAFVVIFGVLDNIKRTLNTFIECTDKEYHGMACAAEALLNDIEGEYPMLYRLKAKADECGSDTVTFDKFVGQYVEHKDDLLESYNLNESEELDVINTGYHDTARGIGGSIETWEDCKKKLIDKFSKQYNDVKVKRVKSDTKGLIMYQVLGKKKSPEEYTINEAAPSKIGKAKTTARTERGTAVDPSDSYFRWEQDFKYSNSAYKGYITDKAGNKYEVGAKTVEGDAGRIANGSMSYYVTIYLPDDDSIKLDGYMAAFSTPRGQDIISDLEQGYYLEDYLYKHKNDITRDTREIADKILADYTPGEIKSYSEIQLEKEKNKWSIGYDKRYTGGAYGRQGYNMNKSSTYVGYVISESGEFVPTKERDLVNDDLLNKSELLRNRLYSQLNANGYSIKDFAGTVVNTEWPYVAFLDPKTSDVVGHRGKLDKSSFPTEESVTPKIIKLDLSNSEFFDTLKDVIAKSRKSSRAKEIAELTNYFFDNPREMGYYPKGAFGNYARGESGSARSAAKLKATDSFDSATETMLRGDISYPDFLKFINLLPAKELDKAAEAVGADTLPTESPIIGSVTSDEETLRKMTAWHNGERRENYRAMSPEKLQRSYNACKELGFEREMELLKDAAAERGIALQEAYGLTEAEEPRYTIHTEVCKIIQYVQCKDGSIKPWEDYKKKLIDQFSDRYDNLSVRTVRTDGEGLSDLIYVIGNKKLSEEYTIHEAASYAEQSNVDKPEKVFLSPSMFVDEHPDPDDYFELQLQDLVYNYIKPGYYTKSQYTKLLSDMLNEAFRVGDEELAYTVSQFLPWDALINELKVYWSDED